MEYNMHRLIHLLVALSLVLPLSTQETLASFIADVPPEEIANVKPQLADPISTPNDPQTGIQNHGPSFAPDRLVVKLRAGVEPRLLNSDTIYTGQLALDNLLSKQNVQKAANLFPLASATDRLDLHDLSNIYLIHLKPGADLLEIARDLSVNPEVEWAEPDYLAYPAATTPNDPLFPEQWGSEKIQAGAAWDVTTGDSSVAIAILDSGVDFAHPDLAGKLWVNPGETAGNGVDDDNNGYIDDVNGWDFVNADNDPADDHGHGTQVAGIAAAATNNNLGISGVCWECRIMPLVVMQASGAANYSDIAAGVLYAAQKGAKVINISLGGYSYSSALLSAIQTAVNTYGAVVVGGAGNDNVNTPFYPAAYEEVLAVAGTAQDDTKVGLSNHGAWLDVSAPAVAITTTFMGGDYGAANGTSFAAPFVSGLAGLIRAQHPDWSPALVGAQIVHTAAPIDALNPGYEGKMGSGRIDARGAVTTTPAPLLRFVQYTADDHANGGIKTGVVVNLVVTIHNDWLDAANVSATLSTGDSAVKISKATASWGAIGSQSSAANTADPFLIQVTAGTYNHSIPFTLQVKGDGHLSTLTFTASTESATVVVGGTLISDTTWTNDRIYVANNVIVEAGVTLTIQAGTLVKFNPDRALIVRGTLVADGLPDAPVRFTSGSASPAAGDWGGTYSGSPTGGIVFASESQPATFDAVGNYTGGSIIRHAVLEYSQGGIQAGSAAPFIDHNLLKDNADSAVGCGPCSSGLVISHNRIQHNTGSALNLVNGAASLVQNLITDNVLAVRAVGGHEVISNTITSNRGDWCHSSEGAICFEGSGDPPMFRGNNIFANASQYDISMGTGAGATGDIDGTRNYWGTADTAAIQARIYDFTQEINAGVFTFTPFLTSPDPSAPVFLDRVALNPSSPVGIEQVTFDLTFSGPMDPAVSPQVSFGNATSAQEYTLSENTQWIDENTWRATYDITSLVPRGTYTVTVSSAHGLDGMEIPVDTRFTFVVDYAGAISDTTPPGRPIVTACAGSTSDALSAQWLSSDPDSAITLYQYAVGTTPGGVDVVNWTNTTETSFTRTGLGIVPGQAYYIAVKARNAGGLWSEPGIPDGVVAGSGVCTTNMSRIYLPITIR